VKWDYELRDGQPVDAVVDRALDIAMTEPRGPVYLTLPREVLANPATHARRDTVRPLGVASPEPARRIIEEAASLIAKAEFPLIVTSTVGRDPNAVTELAALANEFALRWCRQRRAISICRPIIRCTSASRLAIGSARPT